MALRVQINTEATHTHRREEGEGGEAGEEGSVSWRKLAALWCRYAADAVFCSAMHAGKTEQTGAWCEMEALLHPVYRLPHKPDVIHNGDERTMKYLRSWEKNV